MKIRKSTWKDKDIKEVRGACVCECIWWVPALPSVKQPYLSCDAISAIRSPYLAHSDATLPVASGRIAPKLVPDDANCYRTRTRTLLQVKKKEVKKRKMEESLGLA